MSDVRTERCQAMRPAILELIGLAPQLLGSRDILGRFTGLANDLLKIHALGADGIEDPAYHAWINDGGRALRALRDAAAAGDRKAAFAAYGGQDGAMFPIGQGCSGTPGF